MNIPAKFKDAKIDNSIQLENGKSWYLWGDPGVGKTHFIYALRIARNQKLQKIRAKEDNENLVFPRLSMINWADYIDETRYAKFEEKSDMINEMLKVPYLILDDLGVEHKTEFSDTVLYRILNHRHDWSKYTAFTSNVKIGELDYSGRVISRIIGIVGENKFELKGEDRRWKIGRKSSVEF